MVTEVERMNKTINLVKFLRFSITEKNTVCTVLHLQTVLFYVQ